MNILAIPLLWITVLLAEVGLVGDHTLPDSSAAIQHQVRHVLRVVTEACFGVDDASAVEHETRPVSELPGLDPAGVDVNTALLKRAAGIV